MDKKQQYTIIPASLCVVGTLAAYFIKAIDLETMFTICGFVVATFYGIYQKWSTNELKEVVADKEREVSYHKGNYEALVKEVNEPKEVVTKTKSRKR